jgi:hypothetical protein
MPRAAQKHFAAELDQFLRVAVTEREIVARAPVTISTAPPVGGGF